MHTLLFRLRRTVTGVVTAVMLAGCAHAAARTAPGPSPGPAVSGVYQTSADFAARALSLSGPCTGGDHSLKLDARDDRADFAVIHSGVRQRVRKADVFGTRECDGRERRFVRNRAYEVLALGPLVLYRYTWRVPGPRSWVNSTLHYFATSLDADPVALTRVNLKTAFPANHRLHDLIDLSFPSDKALTAYDKSHGEYRVIQALKLSRESSCGAGVDRLSAVNGDGGRP